MKSWLPIVFLLFPTFLWSQSADMIRREADEALNSGRYELAIDLYRQSVDIDPEKPEAIYGLANASRLAFQYEQAEHLFRKVRNTWAEKFPLSVYYYALMLKLNGNFQSAAEEFTSFISTFRNTGRYPEFLEQAYVEKAGCELALVTIKSLQPGELLPEPVNTSFNDFSPTFYGDDVLIITSARGKGWSARKDLRYGEGFMDQYAFRLSKGIWREESFSLLNVVNTRYHEGNGAFSSDFKRFYFTSCGEGSVNCRIFFTRLTDSGDWSKPAPLGPSINLPGYDSKQAALSNGGDTLYFVSNRPGGVGGNDIWVSTSVGENRWRSPYNLRQVNTAFNELSPFVLNNGILLFASEGHQGFGGYDLYLFDPQDTLVVNAGYPFNSSMDDAYAVAVNSSIYWSSNRKGGAGNFDLYFLRSDSVTDQLINRLKTERSALRGVVSEKESKQMQTAMENVYEDPFAFETLPARQKQLINEVITSRRAGRDLPSELDYLSAEEKEFILKVADDQMRKQGNR